MKPEYLENLKYCGHIKLVRKLLENPQINVLLCNFKEKMNLLKIVDNWIPKKEPIDIIFSYFPLISTVYSAITLNFPFVLRSITVYLTSLTLKAIYKKERLIKRSLKGECLVIKRFSIEYIKHMIKNIESKYAFPSTHSLFFYVLYKFSPSLFAFVIFLGGTFSRVYYKYHDIDDVIFGVFVGSMFCDLWDKIHI